jgi:hypothetical protein
MRTGLKRRYVDRRTGSYRRERSSSDSASSEWGGGSGEVDSRPTADRMTGHSLAVAKRARQLRSRRRLILDVGRVEWCNPTMASLPGGMADGPGLGRPGDRAVRVVVRRPRPTGGRRAALSDVRAYDCRGARKVRSVLPGLAGPGRVADAGLALRPAGVVGLMTWSVTIAGQVPVAAVARTLYTDKLILLAGERGLVDSAILASTKPGRICQDDGLRNLSATRQVCPLQVRSTIE